MRTLSIFSILSLAVACTSSKGDDTASGDIDTDVADPLDVDDDGDGQTENDGDCDDTNADIYTGADETCDGVDNNCSGDETDATDIATWYADADADGFGDGTADAVMACEMPSGYVADNTDCDDTMDVVYPGADETCDGIDNNCSGDELDASDVNTYYADVDGDGYGDATDADEDGMADNTTMACEVPSGYADNMDDCNDAEALAWTGADEVCDGIDNNCDGDADSDAIDQTAWYADADADTYGDATDADEDGMADNMVMACEQPSGYVANMDDCNDAEALAWTGATEVCDGVDNNCVDGETDSTDLSMFYMDSDMDGYGDPNMSISTCDDPSTTETCYDVVVEDSYGDEWNGGALSIYVDGVMVDSGLSDGSPSWCGDCTLQTAGTFYNTGSASSETYSNAFCALPGQNITIEYASDNYDSENDYSIIGNGVTLFAANGADGDGTVFDATLTAMYVSNMDDCNDAEALAWTGATEVCDGVDNDCDGDIDSTAVDILTWYKDLDADGYGDPNVMTMACDQPSAYVDNMDDCNDNEALAWTGADEVCDSVDNDCDGNTDDNAVDVYADTDGDGYGDPSMMQTADCAGLSGYVDNMDDCDDNNMFATPDDLDGDGVSGCPEGVSSYMGTHSLQYNDGSYGPGEFNCDAYWMAESTAVTSDCPDCVFEFDLELTYDASISTDDGTCGFDLVPVTGFNVGYVEDFYGYGQAVIFDQGLGGIVTEQDGTIDFDGTNFSYEYGDLDYYYYGAYYSDRYSGSGTVELADAPDCDDDDAFTYPGAAYLDSDMDCLTDADEDGFGARNLETCFILQMEDSFGDGWNGGHILATVNGTPIASGLPEFIAPWGGNVVPADSFYTDTYYNAVSFCLPEEGLLQLEYTIDTSGSSSSYESENTYTLYDSQGNVLFSDGPTPAVGIVGEFGDLGGGSDCDDGDDTILGDSDGDGAASCDGDCDDNDASLNLLDEDADGFNSCDGDCDDNADYAYPGAAFNESSTECLADFDGDGYSPTVECFTIEMEDSFGDGWNDTQVAVWVDGVEWNYYTLDDGDYGSEEFCVEVGAMLDFQYIAGSWGTEITGSIFDGTGSVIVSFEGNGFGSTNNYFTVDGVDYYDTEVFFSTESMNPSSGSDCDDMDSAIRYCYTGYEIYTEDVFDDVNQVYTSCGLYWDAVSSINGTTCATCEFEFDLALTYDASQSAEDPNCAMAPEDYTFSYGYDSDYYGEAAIFYNGGVWFVNNSDADGDGADDSFVSFNGTDFSYETTSSYYYNYNGQVESFTQGFMGEATVIP